MLGSKGTKLYISSIGTGGENFCNTVGTSQGISNIEAFGTWKIYELWMEQSMLDDRASIKLGLYDLNTEFDARITSSFFINPSHGIGADFSQSGKNGPSIFPTTSMTLRARYKTESNFSIQAAVLDGVPGDPDNPKGTHVILNKNDGLLFTAETGYGQNEESFGAGFEKYVIGGWYYNSRFSSFAAEDYASSGHKGNFGVYASAEKFVYSENDNPAQGISAFLRVGYAESTINRFNSYIGAGAIYKGLFDKRDDDVLGIAIAIAGYSSEFIDTFRSELPNISGPEINLEITYSMQLTGWLNIQPDFQYVANPTYCISNKYAFIAGLRTSVTY
jgi:porin